MEKDSRLSVKQAADILGVHTNTIYGWMKDGRLRADKEGKSYKINHMDVLNIYNSKNRVDKDREVLLSTQIVREEALDLLSIKAG
ncbi:helix-turn-helix domain-containing protein, partial [Paraclostridium sordellii]|uniref:helix-turn-helix domain-containing protein n=1 Tax=Paraclostridium sordellii TaxID=1505 RepID=UPI0012D9F21A